MCQDYIERIKKRKVKENERKVKAKIKHLVKAIGKTHLAKALRITHLVKAKGLRHLAKAKGLYGG